MRNTFISLRGLCRVSPTAFYHYPIRKPLSPASTKIFEVLPKGYCSVAEESKSPMLSARKDAIFIPRGAPSCEWNHIHDTQPQEGSILRAYYHNRAVHFYFFQQEKTREELLSSEKTREDGSHPSVPIIKLCDSSKRRSVALPTPFICRLLAVLDGAAPSAEIVTKNTQGSFSGDFKAYTFQFSCTSEPTSQEGTATEWKFTFSPGESIVLQRFLTIALEKNYGFSTYADQPMRPRKQSKQ